MSPKKSPPDPDDDLSYEDLDELESPAFEADVELEPIDLDALDDMIEEEEAVEAKDTAVKPEPVAEAGPAPKKPPKAARKPPHVAPPKKAESPAPVAGKEPPAVEESPLPEPAPAAETQVAAPEAETPAAEKIPPPAKKGKTAPPTAPAAEPEPPPPPVITYRVLLALSPDLEKQVLALRTLGEAGHEPPPGIDLIAAFRAESVTALEEALGAWARNHLPLQLEITGIEAEVRDAQQYIAAWTLQPGEDLDEAQRDLARALEPVITPLPDMPPVRGLRLTVADHLPPRPYPHVVVQMQRDFEPFIWHAESVILAGQEEGALGWETARSFR